MDILTIKQAISEVLKAKRVDYNPNNFNESVDLLIKELNRYRQPQAILIDDYDNLYCPHCKNSLWETMSNKNPHCSMCGTRLNWNITKEVRTAYGHVCE